MNRVIVWLFVLGCLLAGALARLYVEPARAADQQVIAPCGLPQIRYLGDQGGGFASGSPTAGIYAASSPPRWGSLLYPEQGQRAWFVDLLAEGVSAEIQPSNPGYYYIHPEQIQPGETLRFWVLAGGEGAIRLTPHADQGALEPVYNGPITTTHLISYTAEITSYLEVYTEPAAHRLEVYCIDPAAPEPGQGTIPPPTATPVSTSIDPTEEPATHRSTVYLPLVEQ